MVAGSVWVERGRCGVTVRAVGRLGAMRGRAESLMTLTLRAYSPGFAVVDGLEERVFQNEGTTLGRVQAASVAGVDARERSVSVGGVDRPVLAAGLHLPVSATVPVAGDRGVGWEYVVESVADPADSFLLGKRFLVVSVPVKSFATARRLDVVEVGGL